MPATVEKKATKASSKELESVIAKAMKKINSKEENTICRYLPMKTGGYMHHFTLRKMKNEVPEELAKLINKYICNCDKPKTVAPKPRAARGSRKRRDSITFSRTELEHMLRIARLAGDKDLIRKLTPKRDLKTIKRELLTSIRQNKVEPELWNSYCEVVTAPKDEEEANQTFLPGALTRK